MWGHLFSASLESALEASPRRVLNARLRHLGSSKPDREDAVKPGPGGAEGLAGGRKPREGRAAARRGRGQVRA